MCFISTETDQELQPLSDRDLFSRMLIHRLANREAPFDRWLAPGVVIESEYQEVVSVGVWGYQLHTYLESFAGALGPDSATRIRENLVHTFDQTDGSGTKLQSLLELIARAAAVQPIPLPQHGPSVQVPVEINVALTLLFRVADSPLYMRYNLKAPRIEGDIDWRFAKCLRFGRQRVLC